LAYKYCNKKYIKLIKKKKIFLLNKFYKRRINICLDVNNFAVIKYWYHSKLYHQPIISVFIKYKFFFLNYNIIFLIICIWSYYLSFKKKIYLNEKDIILFGPWPNSYSHQIHEFLTRLIYLKNLSKKNFFSKIYVPVNLKKFLQNSIFKKVFSTLDFVYYDTSKNNYIFYNSNYLTHPDNRCVVTDIVNKKLLSSKVKSTHSGEYKKLLNSLRKNIYLNLKLENSYPKFILISRKNALRRVLLNENELYLNLKNFGFQLLQFENYSIDEQIKFSMNSSIMLGYHGAGLTNLIFMKKKSLVIEIRNKFYNHPHMEIFAKAQNIKFKTFYCSINFNNLDGYCNIDEIVNFIKKLKIN
jgi:hypothetical protein